MKKEIIFPIVFGLFTAFFASYTSPFNIIEIGKATELVIQNLIFPIIILSIVLAFFVYKFYSKVLKQESSIVNYQGKSISKLINLITFGIFEEFFSYQYFFVIKK